METLWQDVKYGIRILAKAPGFTAVAVLTLALGIGANTAIFALVNAILLHPLPYRDAGQLIMVWATDLHRGVTHDVTSYPNFTDWQGASRSFEGMAAFTNRTFNLSGGDTPERLTGLQASERLLPMLGVDPERGRSLFPEDYRVGAPRVVLLSHGLWQRRFGGDSGILGQTVRINDDAYTVVGILPLSFNFPPDERADFCVPLLPDSNRNHGFLMVIGRLKTNTSLQAAQVEMDDIARRLEKEYPDVNKGVGANLVPLQESVVRQVRAPLLIFLGAVTFVLLIACANVANLLLARAATRQKEFAVRAALGAGRLRLTRQLLTEGALLAFAGGILGLLLAAWGVDLLAGALHHNDLDVPLLDNVRIDVWVLAFTMGVSFLTGIVFSLAPALGAAKLDTNETLKEGGRGATERMGLRRILVTAEVALSLVLLAGAGLLVKSFLLLEQVNPGVHAENVLTMELSLLGVRYKEPGARDAMLGQVLERVGALPGVKTTALVADLPFAGNEDSTSFDIEGAPKPAPNEGRDTGQNFVSPDYFRTLGIPLHRGRTLTDSDGREAPGAVVIDEAMARRFWPGKDPLGRRIAFAKRNWFTIIGVVADVPDLGLQREPRPEAYVCYRQDLSLWTSTTLVVRTEKDPLQLSKAVREAVWGAVDDLPISHVKTMEQVLSASLAQPRLLTFLLSIFGGLALLLAGVGLYGVISFTVEQRTHEIGIRMALGAQARNVRRMILGQGLRLVLAGVVIGLAGALALTRVMAGLLFHTEPTDPATFVAVAAVLLGIAGLACYVPARRAVRVDPIVALRHE